MAPLRVLHVVGKMNRGGIETWLMHLLRRLDRSEATFDFLVETAEPAAYDAEIRSLGARIIHCERNRRLWSYGRRLARTLDTFGPYDVVHSHADVFNGFILAAASQLGIPGRISHSHNDMRMVGRTPGIVRSVYYSLLRVSLRHTMSHGLAVSVGAAQDMFGERYAFDPRVRVLPCGIDYSPFRKQRDRLGARTELGISHDAKVVGHIGRFDPQKNHGFLLDAFAIAARRNPTLHLLLVGGGQLQPTIEQRTSELGLGGRVAFAGLRDDIPRMLAAMDAFAFPSVFEGLGLVLIEAQAAGLPILMSDRIPTDAIISGHLVKRLALASPDLWAAAMSEFAALPAHKRVRSFDEKFDIDHNLGELLTIYRRHKGPLLNPENDRPIRQVAALEQRRQVHPRH